MNNDYYEILGVSPTASQDEVKRAYRRLARQHHPDANQGDAASEDRFKEISHAYETLSDPERRRHYDMFGADAGVGVGGPGPSGFGVGIDDIFDAFFGGSPFGGTRSRSSSRPAGRDLAVEMELDFTEAIFGIEREVELRMYVLCTACDGGGTAEGTHAETCSTCGGRGEVQQVRRTMLGQVVTAHACPACRGQGIVIAHPCPTCRGEGRVAERRTLTLQVPAGVDDGAQLRLGGRGDMGVRGGPSGDLYVRMRVSAPPEGWSRDGTDLRYRLPVPVTTAALGGKLSVRTLEDEELDVDVRPGTQVGAAKRFRGKGVPRVSGSGRGELYVDLHVVVPTNLTPEQEELLQRLGELRGENTDSAGVVERIKQAFR